MRKSMLVFSVVLVSAALMSACSKDRSSSPLAPSAESRPASAAPSPSPAPAASAQISGVVIAGASGQALTASTPSLNGIGQVAVTVLGTTLTTVSDSAGNFTLQNVPAGTVTLGLSGSGVNAQVAVTVSPQEQVRLTVRVAGGSASLDDSQRVTPDNQIEVEGAVTAVAGNTITVGSFTTPITISSTTVVTRSGAAVSASTIAVGQRVEVHAVRTGSAVNAERINIESPSNTPSPTPGAPIQEDVEVAGKLTAAPSGTCPAISFVLGTVKVSANASTRFDDVACASLASGDTLTVEGLRQPDGSVRASEIKRTSGGSPGGDDSDKDDNGSNNRGSGSGNSGSGSNGSGGNSGGNNSGNNSGGGSGSNGGGSSNSGGGNNGGGGNNSGGSNSGGGSNGGGDDRKGK